MSTAMYIPTRLEIDAARKCIGPYISETPAWHWQGDWVQEVFGTNTQVYLKLELFQHTGTFKPRSALLKALQMTEAERLRGVTAVSAGNHAAAVAYAANRIGTSAKVVMPKTASSFRMDLCRAYGAELVLTEDVHAAFVKVQEIEAEEGRTFLHPFDSPEVVLGTATLGQEFCQQVPELDAVIIPVGGGGLCAGVAVAVKQVWPACKIYAVEPFGADTLHRSFLSGHPEKIGKVETIADSLGSPHAMQYSFDLCRKYVSEIVRVDDDALCVALYHLFSRMKLAVEPAGAASTAALLGPLRNRLAGKKVGLIVCGANIDAALFGQYLQRGALLSSR